MTGEANSEAYATAFASCIVERGAMRDLLKRLREWDHLGGAADGEYWKSEIDRVLDWHDEVHRAFIIK